MQSLVALFCGNFQIEQVIQTARGWEIEIVANLEKAGALESIVQSLECWAPIYPFLTAKVWTAGKRRRKLNSGQAG
jgi:hypothetical protein